MTIRRDLYAKLIKLRLQADGAAGALVDHVRTPNVITPNDFATDSAHQLYGVNAFTGKPGLPPIVFGPIFTLEGYVRFNPTTADQTLISALNPTSGRSTEWALTLRGSNNLQFDVYQGVRGSSEVHGQPTFAAALPTGSLVHFFLCSTYPGTYWMGVNGVLSTGKTAVSNISSTLGNALNPTLLGGLNTGVVASGQPWLGQIHSMMLTDGAVRYPFNASGTYKQPDDLLTNYYQDLGPGYDPVDGSADFQVVRSAPVIGGAKYQNGDRKIAGHVTYSGVVSARRVVLFHRATQLAVAWTTSRASDGYFEFLNLDPKHQYFVAGFDDNPSLLNAEIADHLVPA